MPLSSLALTTAPPDGSGLGPWSPSCAHLQAALDSLPLGLLTFDSRLDVLVTNDRLATMLAIQTALIGRTVSILTLLEHSALLDLATMQAAYEVCLSAVRTQAEQKRALATLAGRDSRCFALQVQPLSDGQWIAAFEEVTDRRAAETRAIEMALHDPLTGLPGRELFTKRVIAALSEACESSAHEAGGAAVMLIDLDRFKSVNDTLGHPVGDGLLRLVSKRLRHVLRQPDMVARLGGDEFGLLVYPAPDLVGLGQLGRRIIDVLDRPYLVDGHLVNIGASVGVAISPADGREHDRLLRGADLALYASKKAGRGTCTFFEPSMDANALARRSLEIDLRKALALRQFELHYQPQIDLELNAVVGFEALLRWRHPERGLVSPADFIPLAEEIGLIVPLGEWVLREACQEAMRWPDDVSVAVNVSPYQFGDPTKLIEVVTQALAGSGLPGRRLEIEITESVLLRNEQAVLTALHQLRALRVRVAMDDFGTGYSSLSQLHSFPFDRIKIDRSFVRDRGDVAGQNAIIRAITALGASLGMSTIAEGVETSGQLDRIRAEGCTSVQGYLFSRPVPVEQIDDLIAAFAGRRAPSAANEGTALP